MNDEVGECVSVGLSVCVGGTCVCVSVGGRGDGVTVNGSDVTEGCCNSTFVGSNWVDELHPIANMANIEVTSYE